jgi:hypothetical protein
MYGLKCVGEFCRRNFIGKMKILLQSTYSLSTEELWLAEMNKESIFENIL